MSYNRIKKEFASFEKSPIDGITMGLADDFDLFHWQATIFGPEGSVYEGGIFHLDIKIPAGYPMDPPKYTFKTKIYHPNIDSDDGRISLNILTVHWSPALQIRAGLLSIMVLMTSPNFDDVMDPRVAQIYKKNPAEFKAIAREWTQKYAI